MSKNIVLLVALFMALVMALCACGSNSAPEDNGKDPTEASSNENITTEPTDPENPTAPTGDPVTPPVDEPDDQPYMQPAKALFGASPDGYGIWSVATGLSTTKRLCVDTNGYVVFDMDSSESDVAGVYNNAVLMQVNFDYYILRSVPSGEVIFASANANGAKIILPEHSGKEMFRDGYIMVVKPSESEEAASCEIGFMNPQGSWISPLSADCVLLKHLGSNWTIDQLEKKLSYLGEGILGLLCSDGVYRYYNMDIGSVTKVQFPTNLTKQTICDALDYSIHFIDGVSEPVFLNNNYYLFYSDGRIETFKVLWPKGLPRSEKCGNPYFDRKTKTAFFLYDYGKGILVANSEGKIINKQEGFELVAYQGLNEAGGIRSGFGSDGYARIVLKNEDGDICYAVIDISGNFLFQPLVLDQKINTIYDTTGYRINVSVSDGSSAYYAVIDNEGILRHQSDYVEVFSVKNGVVFFSDDGVEVYLDILTSTK